MIRDKEIQEQLQAVNRILPNTQIKLAHRYNYRALDLYDKEGRCLKTIIAGCSAREVYNFLDGYLTIKDLETI
jgi:hypothetical protein